MGLEEGTATPTGAYYAWGSAAGQPDHMPNLGSSERFLVGTAEGFRRPVPAGRVASENFRQLVSAIHSLLGARNCCAPIQSCPLTTLSMSPLPDALTVGKVLNVLRAGVTDRV